MYRSGWILPLAAAVAFGQTTGGLKREGYYWVQTLSGNLSLPKSGRLKLTTRGRAVVRGEDRENVAFVLTKRAKTRTEEEARLAFERYTIKTKSVGEWAYLIVVAPDSNHPSPELQVKVPRSLKQVIIENQGGAVEGYNLDGTVGADTSGGQIVLDKIGGNASARSGGGDIQLGWIGGSVRCLSGGGSIRVERVDGEAWLESAGGEIFIREARAPVRASTAGNIQVEKATHSVVAKSAGGLIEVRQAGGPVIAETGGGSIQIGSTSNVRCESGAGPIRLRDVTGALRASTSLGTILASLTADGKLEDSVLNTGSGDIIVTIPSNLAVRVWAQTDPACSGGRVVSDFSEIRVRKETLPCSAPVIAEGALNGGGPLLRVSAAGGSVYLRRQK